MASATLRPCATRTSTWRSLATIASGLCLLRGIAVLLGAKAIPQGGPLRWGRLSGSDVRPHVRAALLAPSFPARPAADPLRIGPRDLGPEQEDRRRVVDPQQ